MEQKLLVAQALKECGCVFIDCSYVSNWKSIQGRALILNHCTQAESPDPNDPEYGKTYRKCLEDSHKEWDNTELLNECTTLKDTLER